MIIVEVEMICKVLIEISVDDEVIVGVLVVKKIGCKFCVVSIVFNILVLIFVKEIVVFVMWEGLVDSEENIFFLVFEKDGDGFKSVEKKWFIFDVVLKGKEVVKSVGCVVKSFMGSSVKSMFSGSLNKLR